jgi:hypothetical protein
VFLADTNADELTASVVVDVESLPKAAALAPPYAAPAPAADPSGLPPPYIAAAQFCPNRDEGIGYTLRDPVHRGLSAPEHRTRRKPASCLGRVWRSWPTKRHLRPPTPGRSNVFGLATM